MTPPPTPEFQLEFLDYVQRLLDGGRFAATYKYALLLALGDLSVEMGDDSGAPLRIHSRDIAAKFVRYYSRQAVPYPNGSGVLQQNRGGQAAVVKQVRESVVSYSGCIAAKTAGSPATPGLIASVARVVREQPLWRLQVIGDHVDDFLYPQRKSGPEIELRAGIAFCFRRFHGFVCRLAQDGWMRWIRERRQNLKHLGEDTDLGAFMFGADRAALTAYRPLLREIQSGSCFYCARPAGRSPHVDHFVPWSWYSLDLGQNFVLACRTCNSAKRDVLAAERHLERWVARNNRFGDTVSTYCRDNDLPEDLPGTLAVARWAYRRSADGRGRTWIKDDAYEHLSGIWKSLLMAR